MVKFVKEIFSRLEMSGMTSQEVWLFATGKCIRKFCDLIEYMIYISGYQQTFGPEFVYAGRQRKTLFLVVLFRINFGCKFGKMICFGKFSVKRKLNTS